MIIAQGQTSIVQAGHRFNKAEAESDARSLAVRAAAVKTLCYMRLISISYPRTVVGKDDVDFPVIAAFDTRRCYT
jgi:hypothetical protein